MEHVSRYEIKCGDLSMSENLKNIFLAL